MTTSLSKTRIIAIATAAFVGGVFFASSMDWTDLLVAQSRPGAPVVNMAAPGRGDVQGGFTAIAEQVTPREGEGVQPERVGRGHREVAGLAGEAGAAEEQGNEPRGGAGRGELDHACE